MSLPEKLKRDPIAEALFQVRFESKDSTEFPELTVAKLAGFGDWASFQKNRTPMAEVPASMRQQREFKYSPVLELKDEEKARVVRISENAISIHALAPYPGWAVLRPEIDTAVKWVAESLEGFKPTRLGFRYVNRLNKAEHLVGSVADLAYTAKIGKEVCEGPQNFNYMRTASESHQVLVRIASPHFVTGGGGKALDALVDVDVFTPDNWETKSIDAVLDWVDQAHTFEKSEFFKLLPPKILAELVEK